MQTYIQHSVISPSSRLTFLVQNTIIRQLAEDVLWSTCFLPSTFSFPQSHREGFLYVDQISYFFRLKLSEGGPSHSEKTSNVSPHSILSLPSWYWFKSAQLLALPGCAWNYAHAHRSWHSLSPLCFWVSMLVSPPLRSFPPNTPSRLAALTIIHFFLFLFLYLFYYLLSFVIL